MKTNSLSHISVDNSEAHVALHDEASSTAQGALTQVILTSSGVGQFTKTRTVSFYTHLVIKTHRL